MRPGGREPRTCVAGAGVNGTGALGSYTTVCYRSRLALTTQHSHGLFIYAREMRASVGEMILDRWIMHPPKTLSPLLSALGTSPIIYLLLYSQHLPLEQWWEPLRAFFQWWGTARRGLHPLHQSMRSIENRDSGDMHCCVSSSKSHARQCVVLFVFIFFLVTQGIFYIFKV